MRCKSIKIKILCKGKVQKKGKKLTNVSFAFTHTYTPVKTNIFPFFPQAYMENFEKCAKTQKQKNNMLSHVTWEGGVGANSPLLVTKIPPHMVQNLYSERELSIKLLLGEKTKKN